jgi:AcrR family transcriptional regulator
VDVHGAEPNGPGRPRDASIDARAIRAVLRLLDRVPYGELTLEAVAAEAGTSKPALRRRWRNLPGVVVHALIATLGTTPTPDTGCVHCDLITGITNLADAFADSALARALPGLVSDLRSDPELAEVFRRDYFEARRKTSRTVIEAAIARGEVAAGIDVELVLDLLAAPLYYRVIFGHQPISRELAERTVMSVLDGIATPLWRKNHP